MVSIYDVDPRKLIENAASELKKMPEMKAPFWSAYVKTGMQNERPPVEEDWWYIRSAAVLRSVYKLGPIGVSKLRTKYGGRKNRGVKPDKAFKASGNILRKILQGLEKSGLVVQDEKGVHKGRVLTPKGKSFMDKLAVGLVERYNPAKTKEKAPKTEHKETKEKAEEKAEKPTEDKKPAKAEKETKKADVKEAKEVKEAPKEDDKKGDQ